MIRSYGPGAVPLAVMPGDIGVVRHYRESAVSELIQAGERTRYGHTPWANFSHAFLFVGRNGDIVEANSGGVEIKNVAEYRNEDFVVIDPNVPYHQRAYAVRFVMSQVGTKYDYLDFVGLAVQATFAADLSIHHVGAFICSGLVARATEAYTFDGYPRSPEAMMPADLVAEFHPTLHEAPVPLSRFAHFLDVVATAGRVLTR